IVPGVPRRRLKRRKLQGKRGPPSGRSSMCTKGRSRGGGAVRRRLKMPSVPLEETISLALAVVVAGGLSGILSGLFGIGGGAVIVPALYEVFRILDVPEGVRMQLCIGTSLAIMVPTSIRSYLAHRSKGAVIPDVILMWSLSAVVGVVVGSLVAVA